MKKTWLRLALVLLCVSSMVFHADAYTQLVPGGQVVGLEIDSGSVIIAAFDDTLGQNARDAGLQIGDRILSVDGSRVESVADLKEALRCSDGFVELEVWRSGKERSVRVEPNATPEGPKLGVMIREGITGVGTVTWYDPDTGQFGTLGHGVNNSKGELLPMKAGRIFGAGVQSVKKGKVGTPGQLKGALTDGQARGILTSNTERGVFGTASVPLPGEPIPVARRQEVHPGNAVIRATVSGQCVGEYTVEILRLYPENRGDGRDMLIRVTDPGLLETTGGIVQGMSGSPIIQNGRLIGAVTHVLVNDPQRGYGIFIENMLEAAQ